MNRLSNAQAQVVDILMSNPDYYIIKSTYYNYNKIVSPEPITNESGFTSHHVHYFTRPTFEVLERIGAIEEIKNSVYKLNNK
jgi:hypothetical protein